MMVEGGQLLHKTIEARTWGVLLTPRALPKTSLKITGLETTSTPNLSPP